MIALTRHRGDGRGAFFLPPRSPAAFVITLALCTLVRAAGLRCAIPAVGRAVPLTLRFFAASAPATTLLRAVGRKKLRTTLIGTATTTCSRTAPYPRARGIALRHLTGCRGWCIMELDHGSFFPGVSSLGAVLLTPLRGVLSSIPAADSIAILVSVSLPMAANHYLTITGSPAPTAGSPLAARNTVAVPKHQQFDVPALRKLLEMGESA